MPRNSLVVQELAREGTALTMTAPTVDGDVLDCGNGVVLVVNNASGAPITVTLPTPATYAGQPVNDVVVTVPAAATRYIKVDNVSLFGQAYGTADYRRAYANYSAVASVTRGAFRS